MRILMIEDDSAMVQTMERILKAEGFTVSATSHGEDGIDLAKNCNYDLVLLDLNLPDMSGMEVLRTLRMAKINTPIMFLSGSIDIETKVRALSGGADDYLTKPFDRDELVARMHAVARRARGHSQSVIQIGSITVNLDAKTADVGGSRLRLTGKEYQILELLSLRKGTTLSKETLLNHLYGGRDVPEIKIIDVFVCKLRKKLFLPTGGATYIETVWGHGYCLRDPHDTQVSGLISRPAQGATASPLACFSSRAPSDIVGIDPRSCQIPVLGCG